MLRWLALSCYPLFAGMVGAQPVSLVLPDSLGNTAISYRVTQFGKLDSTIAFVNVHENEISSVAAAKVVLGKEKRYTLVEMQCKSSRLLSFSAKGKNFTVDPNRIFSEKGILASLKKNSHHYAEPVFREACGLVQEMAGHFLKQFVTNRKLVVALHNNTEGEPLSVINYKSGNEVKNTADVYMNLQKDPDDFFLTTEPTFFLFLKNKGYNVVLQDNQKVEDDGSLSVFAGHNKIPYINIEAQEGHQEEQEKMIKLVLEMVKGLTRH